MRHVQSLITVFFLLRPFVCGQRFVGDSCTLESGSSGECKLFKDCAVLHDFQKHKIEPQTCGFSGYDPIICCPKNESIKLKPGEISKTKCREYSEYAYHLVKNPTLLVNGRYVIRLEAGHKVVKLIYGENPASRKEFPHMAAIGYEPKPGDIQYLCGGTILSPYYILTAAHCLSDDFNGDAKWARLGVTELNDTNHSQLIRIGDQIPHPEYTTKSYYNDIGLLKLERSAQLDPYSRPACLYLKPDVTDEKAIATGWGHTSWAGEGSNRLLKVVIKVFDHSFCNSSYKNQIGRKLDRGIVDEMQFCAGSDSKDEVKDTCQGDSGGPLQIYHVGDEVRHMYDIIGITSFGQGCSGSPGVYVRVSNYVKWIEDVVWPM